MMEFIGFAAAFATTVSFVPQTIKTYRTKQTQDLSLMMYSILCAGFVLWLTYGILMHSWPLIAANTVSLALGAPILIMKVKYG